MYNADGSLSHQIAERAKAAGFEALIATVDSAGRRGSGQAHREQARCNDSTLAEGRRPSLLRASIACNFGYADGGGSEEAGESRYTCQNLMTGAELWAQLNVLQNS